MLMRNLNFKCNLPQRLEFQLFTVIKILSRRQFFREIDSSLLDSEKRILPWLMIVEASTVYSFFFFPVQLKEIKLNINWISLYTNQILIQVTTILMNLTCANIPQRHSLKFGISTVYYNSNLIQVVTLLYNLTSNFVYLDEIYFFHLFKSKFQPPNP